MTTFNELAKELGLPPRDLQDFIMGNLDLEEDAAAGIRQAWATRHDQADAETAAGLADAEKVTVHTQDGEPVGTTRPVHGGYPDGGTPMFGQDGYDEERHATRV